MLLCLAGCTGKTLHTFDVQSGPAETTFLKFAEQAGVGVLFDSKDVNVVITNPVMGKMTMNKALQLMIKETNLVYSFDEEAGLITIELVNDNSS